jgi:hypothetical protein
LHASQTEDKSEVFIFCLMLGPERSSIQQMCCDLPFPHSLHFNWHASSNPHILKVGESDLAWFYFQVGEPSYMLDD